MNTQLRAEFLKQRTTRTTLGLAAAMLGLVVVAIALHDFGLSVNRLTRRSDQLGVFIDAGEIVEDRPTMAFFDHPETDRAKGFLSKILHH